MTTEEDNNKCAGAKLSGASTDVVAKAERVSDGNSKGGTNGGLTKFMNSPNFVQLAQHIKLVRPF